MRYRLTVARIEEDPNYEQRLAKERDRRQYGGGFIAGQIIDDVSQYISTRTIDVELTEEEFNQVRRSLIQSWDNGRTT